MYLHFTDTNKNIISVKKKSAVNWDERHSFLNIKTTNIFFVRVYFCLHTTLTTYLFSDNLLREYRHGTVLGAYER